MMQRREILGAALSVGAVVMAAEARAEDEKKKKGVPQLPAAKEKDKEKDAPPQPAPSKELAALQEAAARCVRDGRVCLARCTDHMAAGMTNMADCQRAVMNMLPVIETMATLAGYRSADAKNLKALAQACIGFCRVCEGECGKHAKMHEECKACGESCAACIKACEAYIGAA